MAEVTIGNEELLEKLNSGLEKFLSIDGRDDPKYHVWEPTDVGKQAGKNYTWSLVYQQKINSFINLNFNYLGRKGESSVIIHTGTVQLRADF